MRREAAKKTAEKSQRLTLDFRLRVRLRGGRCRPCFRRRLDRLVVRAARRAALSVTIRTAASATPRFAPRRTAPPSACRRRRRRRPAAARRPGAGCRGWRPSAGRARLAQLVAQRRGQRRVGQDRLAARRRRPRRAPRRSPAARPGAQLRLERDAGADPNRPPHAQLGQVGEDQRRARPAHPGRLDRQLVARRRSGPSSPRGRGRGCSSSAPRAAPGPASAPGRGRRRGPRRRRSGRSGGVGPASWRRA